jgi:predicted transcriptional regulator
MACICLYLQLHQPPRLSRYSIFDSGAPYVDESRNQKLLEAIAEHEPASIRELARTVDRHPPEVTENVHELADYGLISLEESGRAKRPRLWYDEIEVSGDVSLRESAAGSDSGVAP